MGDVSFEKTVDGDEQLAKLTLGSNGSSSLFSDCPLDEVYIGRKLSYNTGSSYGYSPFYRNTSLRAVEIADAETQIYDNEFYGCSNLQSLKIGDGVTTIGKYAFSGCSALEEFSAGAAVKSIGEDAFSDCTAMKNYYSYSEVPPTCGSQALDDINKWECVLHVPTESMDAYKAAPQWKEFFFIEDAGAFEDVAADADDSVTFEVADGTLLINGAADKAVTIYGVDGGLRVRYDSYAGQSIELPRGIYIVQVSGTEARKVSI
ncbi:MAG: leucine-rich repeat domain-containing protein [Candidatus Amulumruptor caecigallinarius]|nr:leucine-rich repeat domain-containing protein [Candidatus Amulumruptor caecigallinarius]MCM1397822.1 leucine-rich repeat domain-containing protein [Candidatus Amulumruptor caecigallinarius]MCM1453995.1 leucine-rich repeat domain-containing protein [bacterium]